MKNDPPFLIEKISYIYSWMSFDYNFSCQTKHEPYTAEQLSQTQNYSPKFIPNSEAILYVNDAKIWNYGNYRSRKTPTSY
jgi:hypothetical protein